MHNMSRMNAILDGEQQDDFNEWVVKLAEKQKVAALTQIQPYSPPERERHLRKNGLRYNNSSHHSQKTTVIVTLNNKQPRLGLFVIQLPI